MNIPASPDQVCVKLAESGNKITVRALDGEMNMILLEGSPEALEALGTLIVAQARARSSCGYQVAPDGSGSAIFSSRSNFGIYIHRLPCDEHASDVSHAS